MNVFRFHPSLLLQRLMYRFFHGRSAKRDNVRRNGFRAVFAPRKPRRRSFRVAIALFGLALLALLLVFGVIVGAAMLIGGLLLRLWRQRGKPIAAGSRTMAGEYRVLRKSVLEAGR